MTESDRDRHARAQHASEIFDRIQDHPGEQARRRWDTLEMVHAALNINEHSLLRFVDFTGPDVDTRDAQLQGDPEHPGGMERFWLTLFILLANYTSMSATLIEHVRGVMSDYQGTPFAAEEEKRRQRLGSAPVARFIKDLRNVIAHQSTPPLEYETRLVRGGKVSRLAKLNSEEMLKNDRFTAAAREYLEGKGSVVISEVVAEYASLREGYYRWLFDQFEDVHETELAELDDLKREYRRVSGLDGGGPDPVHFARMI